MGLLPKFLAAWCRCYLCLVTLEIQARVVIKTGIKCNFVKKTMEKNIYENWSVKELKEELKKRGAKLSGRKKNLQDRLLFYDRNNNFVDNVDEQCDDSQESEPSFPTPRSNIFKDINSDTVLPPLSKEHILLYLERFSVHKSIGKEMYESHYLVNARIATDDEYFYLRGQCKAQMRRHTQYFVNIRLSFYGSVEDAHCECSVGSGTTAHCKHVTVLLWAIEDMNREKRIKLYEVGTQKLQSFHKPSRDYFGSPLKAENIKHTVPTEDDVVFEPANLRNITSPQIYRDRVRNIVINYSGNVRNAMNYKQNLMPANTYGVIWDHTYARLSTPEQVLFDLKLMDVDENDILEVEHVTLQQAASKQWFEFRRHRLTASHFYNICRTKTDASKKSLSWRLLHPVQFKSKATEHGKFNERKALALFENTYNIKIHPCGLFIHTTYPFLAAFPDGLIGDDTLVEVKCPYNQRFSKITGETIPFLKTGEDGLIYLDSKHPYFSQIQGQLFVTNRLHALLIVYTFVELCVVQVPRDELHISQMFCFLHHFYENYFQPAILEKDVYKDYGAIFFK